MGTMFNQDDYFKDSVGNVILKGDLIRISHFRTIKKKYYMYKTAGDYYTHKNVKYIELRHMSGGKYRISERARDQKMLQSCVVVQRREFHNNPKVDELKRNKHIRD